ncbi:uncharacterized protein MONBRDRAFT_17763 [Monosiga brevicollis MX1]|uniref:AAA+ ATPase domain-containing protein n=1 Tax=Monosiga brevicollis TaxID=81824 RepID=A9URB4_MONBE|nr:uncharacterized protein MONBRDRAFT_17763 [Monosiga brevicollis MX1]EDQ92212.1 predicted protein [Monosiga brevicollis MX1]|eukprot:XP_001743498.1 hypothetical protein [Monosiga brevicollis MX1]
MASDIIDPEDIDEDFSAVGGLQQTIDILRNEVVLALSPSSVYGASKLLKPPKGLLLFGPPGCGKTMLARALAKECDCCFINLRPSSFMDKYYGESTKLVEAVFSLARKLAPTIIFIDEIDSFLNSRSSMDHESSAVIKAQFMTLWDGFVQDPTAQVVVVGATNRPTDVDRAILRRLSRTCHIGHPDERQRHQILQVILRDELQHRDLDLRRLGAETGGYSGNDLRELCRLAATHALQAAQSRTVRLRLHAFFCFTFALRLYLPLSCHTHGGVPSDDALAEATCVAYGRLSSSPPRG